MCFLAGSSTRPGFPLEKSQLLAEMKTIPGHSLAGEKWKRGGDSFGPPPAAGTHPTTEAPCFSAGGEGHIQMRLQTPHTQSKQLSWRRELTD